MSFLGLVGRGFGASGVSGAAGALTIADNGDGTGAVGTITGTTAGSANVVRAYTFSGASAGITLAGSFSRTGDGVVAMALAVGTYFGVLTSDGTAGSAPVFFRVTDSTDQCLWDEILDACVVLIQSLSLSGLTSDKVRRGKIPAKPAFTDIGSAGVLVSPVRETIAMAGNQRDKVGYGVMVTCFKASNGDNTGSLGQELKWRDQIATAFKIKPNYMPLSTVEEVFDIDIEPGAVVLPEAFLTANYDVGSIVLRVQANQPR